MGIHHSKQHQKLPPFLSSLRNEMIQYKLLDQDYQFKEIDIKLLELIYKEINTKHWNTFAEAFSYIDTANDLNVPITRVALYIALNKHHRSDRLVNHINATLEYKGDIAPFKLTLYNPVSGRYNQIKGYQPTTLYKNPVLYSLEEYLSNKGYMIMSPN